MLSGELGDGAVVRADAVDGELVLEAGDRSRRWPRDRGGGGTAEAAAAAIRAGGTPIQDLFASAVHRFGAVWADLVVVSVVALAIATVPVVAVHEGGGGVNETALIGRFAYGIAYFSVVGFVMLRGLPEPAPAQAGGVDLCDGRHHRHHGVGGRWPALRARRHRPAAAR